MRHGYAYYSRALVLALVTRAVHASEVPQTLLLDVVINGRDTGDILAFTRNGHDLSAARADLEAAGFRLPAGAPSDPQAPIRLRSLPGITFHENSLSQTLAGNGRPLAYQLYTDSLHTVVWGGGITAGTGTVSHSYTLSGTTANRHYAIYGVAPARQSVTAGSYTDVIQIIVTY